METTSDGFIRVSQEQFFATVGQMDVHPTPIGNYPYVSEWKLRDGRVVGLSKPDLAYASFKNVKKYFVKSGVVNLD